MKQLKRLSIVTILISILGLTGCDAMNEGYETGKTTVEFVQLSDAMFGELATLEQKLANVEDLAQLKSLQQQAIAQIKVHHQQLIETQSEGSIVTMSEFVVDNVVAVMEYNFDLIGLMAPMNMSIAQRVEAIATEQGYQQHKENLLKLQQFVEQLESNVESDTIKLVAGIEQSNLYDGLKVLLTTTIEEFNQAYVVEALKGIAHLPALIEEEQRWIDYIFQHLGDIQVNADDQLVFTTQEALDAYNQIFAQ